MIEGSVHTISLRLQDWSIRLDITLGGYYCGEEQTDLDHSPNQLQLTTHLFMFANAESKDPRHDPTGAFTKATPPTWDDASTVIPSHQRTRWAWEPTTTYPVGSGRLIESQNNNRDFAYQEPSPSKGSDVYGDHCL